MKLCQYYTSEEQRERDLARRRPVEARSAVLDGDTIVPITFVTPLAGADSPATLDLPALLEITDGELAGKVEGTGRPVPAKDVCLAPPVLRPTAFLDFYSFEQHVRTCRAKRGLGVVPEWYEIPVYYNGNTTALFGHGQRIEFPPDEDRIDYELELACIIARQCHNITEDEADEVIAGYTILNDWSARSLQAKAMKVGLGPAPGKDLATSLGPYLVTTESIEDVRDLKMKAYVNGELWSEGTSGSSRYTFGQMIAFASRCRTLYAGDIIASGTVGSGCGLEQDRFLSPGDRVRLEIEGLGTLENEVVVESRRAVSGASRHGERQAVGQAEFPE